ncbi:chorion peroxidase [Trichonephila clavipes]|uniref:Chorion peroxidase n=1 Tax=Trichonephila clavipes TaxID=2585209 RepID=A0A8X6V991_TRICX|nr:chorion peroxidase [Trichonephila clavipes]
MAGQGLICPFQFSSRSGGQSDATARILVPLKTHRVEELMHINSIEAKSPHAGLISFFPYESKARIYGGTLYLPSSAREIDHYYGGGLMIRAGITLDGRSHLHVFARDTVTAVKYRDEVLEPYVDLFTGAVGPDFMRSYFSRSWP